MLLRCPANHNLQITSPSNNALVWPGAEFEIEWRREGGSSGSSASDFVSIQLNENDPLKTDPMCLTISARTRNDGR
jgi:hypothetical protein